MLYTTVAGVAAALVIAAKNGANMVRVDYRMFEVTPKSVAEITTDKYDNGYAITRHNGKVIIYYPREKKFKVAVFCAERGDFTQQFYEDFNF